MGPDESEIETWDLSKLDDYGVVIRSSDSTDSYVYTYKSPFTTNTSIFSGGEYVYRAPESHPWLAEEPSDLWGDWKDFRKYADYREEDKPCMSWEEYTDVDKNYSDRHLKVVCKNIPDLEQDRILKSLSIMKAELMMKCAPVKLDKIECKMTPVVKHNIVTAWKRLSRYGKSTPFVACFDEYGRRIHDDVRLNTLHGMTIKLVDPMEYGSHYIDFEGIIRDVHKKKRQ